MIIKKDDEARIDSALCYSQGWLCHFSEQGIGLLDCSGNIVLAKNILPETPSYLGYYIAYDQASKQPVILDANQRVVWGDPNRLKVRRRIDLDRNLSQGGSRFGNCFAVPGMIAQTNYQDKNKQGKKIRDQEERQLIIFGDGIKILELPIIVELACFSHDGLSILAYGEEGFAIVDNPFM